MRTSAEGRAELDWRSGVVRCSFLCGMLACWLTALGIANGLPAEEPEYKPMPWHLVDLWWRWDEAEQQPFERYDIDVSLSEEVPDPRSLLGKRWGGVDSEFQVDVMHLRACDHFVAQI